MSDRSVRTRTRVLFVFLLGFLLLLPEMAARVVRRMSASPSGKPAFHRISEGYAMRDALVRDWSTVRFEYHDYYLYAPKATSSETINFTDYFGARATPASVVGPDVDEIIWAFGGSTMQNLEAVDELTLANQIASELNANGVATRLFNFGVGAFESSMELIRFQDLLRRVPVAERPTTVLFYDGFNDAAFGYFYGAGRPQPDVSSHLADVIERNYPRLVAYNLSHWLSEYSVFWSRYVGTKIEQIMHGVAPPDGSSENLAASVNVYVVNVRAAKGICEEFSIRCLFLLQPLLATRTPLTALEEEVMETMEPERIRFARDFYASVVDRMADDSSFHDLSGFYDDSDAPVFFDFGHTSPTAGIPLGREIATRIRVARE